MDIRTAVAVGRPDVKVVLLSGRLDATTSEAAQPVILGALEKGPVGIILQMAHLEFISSAGLRVLLLLSKNAATQGKRVAIIGAQPAIYKIFKIVDLDKSFRFFESEDDAIRELWP